MVGMQIITLILAGKRKKDNLSEAFSVENKAFLKINHKYLIQAVLEALDNANLPKPYLLGILENQKAIFKDKLSFLPETDYILKPNTNYQSPVQTITEVLENLNDKQSLLITTSDNYFLNPQILEEFLSKCKKSKAQFLVGVVNGQEKLISQYPKTKRTWHKLNSQTWLSGANLFFFQDKSINQKSKEILLKLESQRKNPLSFAITVASQNFWFLLNLICQNTSIEKCNEAISKTMGFSTELIILSEPKACIDIDTITDYECAQSD